MTPPPTGTTESAMAKKRKNADASAEAKVAAAKGRIKKKANSIRKALEPMAKTKKKPAADPSADPVGDARAAIQQALIANPNATPAELRAVAAKHDPAAVRASGRSFNARYVVPVNRKLNAGKKKVKKTLAKKRVAKKMTRRAKRRSARSQLSASRRETLRSLVFERDAALMKAMSGTDARAAYNLAAELDGYLAEIAKIVKG